MRLAVNEWIIHIKMFIFAGVVHGLETTCEKILFSYHSSSPFVLKIQMKLQANVFNAFHRVTKLRIIILYLRMNTWHCVAPSYTLRIVHEKLKCERKKLNNWK